MPFKDNDIRSILNYLKKRISGHFSGLAGAPRASSYFSADRKNTLDTVCDVTVSDRYKPKQYKERPCIKICRRTKKNVHAFRVELTPNFSDIYGNNNFNYNVNYLAFAVENITGGWEDEVHIYVLHKNKVLKAVHDLIQMGAVKKAEKLIDKEDESKGTKTVLTAQTKVKDKWGNFINVYKKNFGIVLSNKFIKSEYMDKFGLGLGEDSTFKNNYKLEEALVSWEDKNEDMDDDIIKSSDVKNRMTYEYFPETLEELRDNMIDIVIDQALYDDYDTKEKPINFNIVDTSKIKNMYSLFNSDFYDSLGHVVPEYIDISDWNMSNVENIGYMFDDQRCAELKYIGDISNWNLKNIDMGFGGDDITGLEFMFSPFLESKLNPELIQSMGDLRKWNRYLQTSTQEPRSKSIDIIPGGKYKITMTVPASVYKIEID